MHSRLNIEQITTTLTASPLVTSCQFLVVDETAKRAVYRIRCQLLRPAYQFEIRFIQTDDDILYSYQLFTDRPILRWDNAPHFPALQTFPHHMHKGTQEVDSSDLSGDPGQDLPYILSQLGMFLTSLSDI